MITQQQLRSILDKYFGLQVEHVKIIQRLMFRQSFLVCTFDNKQYVVKDYADTFSLAELTQIWQYYWHLRESDITVGCPLRRMDSNEFHINLKNRYYVVFEYLKGKHPDICHYEKIARALLKYHGVAKASQLMGLVSTGQKLKEVHTKFKYFYDSDYSIKQNILSCENVLYKIADEYDDCSKAIIHGDSILENMILSDDEVCLIDFDNLHYGDPTEDVANTVLSFLYYGSDVYKIHAERYFQVMEFIKSYYGNALLKSTEKRLHYYMQVHCIIDLIRYAENIRFLVRMPKMEEYLLMLVKVICSKNLRELMQED